MNGPAVFGLPPTHQTEQESQQCSFKFLAGIFSQTLVAFTAQNNAFK